MKKPPGVFDRDPDWQALDRFVRSPSPGATLGLVYGRRRQGKTFLLESVTEAFHGFYFGALKQSDTQNRQRLADQYAAFTGSRARVHFDGWEEACEALLALGEDTSAPVPVVIDELPYLLVSAPELPSILQAVLSPRGRAARSWRTRLILCGSATSTMQGLLSGSAPLRGRASLELLVHPFGYRDAARFWGVDHDPTLAMRLHALVGGTAAYRDMCGGSSPPSNAELDQWVAATLLEPASAMLREGSVLLSEEERVSDTGVYFAVLAAVSRGKTRRNEIASAVGKAEGAIAHPLAILVDTRLVAAQRDAFKQKRTTYHIAEPLLRLHQLVIAPNEDRLARRHGHTVWAELAATVASKIYGPHFEHLARTWCAEHASAQTLGGHPSVVAPTQVACREHRCNHELDVVVLASPPNAAQRTIAIGEAKWRSEPFRLAHLHQLQHLRDLLGLESRVKLLAFSGSGFEPELVRQASQRRDIELVSTERLYRGS